MHFYFRRFLGLRKNSKPIRLPARGQSQGNVLISYITWPFQEGYNVPRARGHTNAFEVVAMATAYQELGYCVDVINYDQHDYHPSLDYSVAIDLHGQLEGWNAFLPKKCHRILHATGPHWLLWNYSELKRLSALRDRKGAVLLPQRQVAPSHSASLADQIVVLGNDYTAGSFQFADKPLTRVPLSSAYEFSYPQERDFSLAKKNFLWVGSYGMVHKGLDLVLDAFARMPELSLTVCGRPEKEEDFFRLYEKELLHTPNINFHGWIDMASEAFTQIAKTHAGIIYPSSAEGGAGSVIHSMHAGMVPICTEEASVDLGNFGISIKDGSVEAVMEAALQFASFSDSEIAERARASYDHVRKYHTRDAFKKNYKIFADTLVNSIV
ncbi:MAG: glycosyltransferase [Chthoniobacterales bacterium]